MNPASIGHRTKKKLADAILSQRAKVEAWFEELARQAPPPFYCSIDLRDFGHKIAPVDSNLYPAGFNNICPEDIRTAPPIIRKEIEKEALKLGHSAPSKILVLPEAHTSNAYYIENLYYLSELIRNAGFEVGIGWYPQADSMVKLVSATGKELEAHPIRVEGGVLSAGSSVPDLIILNNDFSSGYPQPLDPVTQPIIPSHTLGWHTRKKTEHFRHYNELAREFAGLIGVDPWLITIDTEEVGPVNFNEDRGIPEVEESVRRMLARMQKEYDARGITRKPVVFVKNNSGTYGMGIMTVHDPAELDHLNRRAKNKMSVGKNKLPIGSMCVQEGIPTATLVDRLAAEPVIYLCGAELIGGFLRTNTERNDEDNLNSQGMAFRKLCMSDLRTPDGEGDEGEAQLPLMELVYGSIARISALATGRELRDHQSQR